MSIKRDNTLKQYVIVHVFKVWSFHKKKKCRARTRPSFGTYSHITCLHRNPTISTHTLLISQVKWGWSDCVKRMIKIQKISRLGLTVQPVSTESGRCFQEPFWCDWPSVIWKGQSCRQKSCPKCFNPLSWIPAAFDAINLIVLQCERMVISGLLSLALQKKKLFKSSIKLIQHPLSFRSTPQQRRTIK